jgi:hypothetical protein
MLWSGCSLQPLQQQPIDGLSQFRKPDGNFKGVAVGVPHGIAERRAVEYEQGSTRPPRIDVVSLEYGRIELIPSSKQKPGIVIGAPHGTFDVHTERAVRLICARSGLAGVIATGFTPTETGGGWRINVNRPTERHITSSEWEIETTRARKTYEAFKRATLKAAHGKLDLYIDIHQNNGSRIEIASVGFSKADARFIKNAYLALRQQALLGRSDIAEVDLAIEPLDEIEVGGWAAKTNGILAVATRSLHFELPADGVMASRSHRELYMPVLADLIRQILTRVPHTNSPAG